MRRLLLIAAVLIVLLVAALGVASTQVTIFVIQPIGAVPKGRTLLLRRHPMLRFVDSADAFCERATGGVNLLCRGTVLAMVANPDLVIARLPYSDLLYLVSTGGKRYER